MRPILICLFFLAFATPGFAVDIYVSPSGSGFNCTTGDPCSLTTGTSQAGNGDTVILKDGTYTGATLVTQADGVTFKAENRRLAILAAPINLRIEHNNITIRQLRFDWGAPSSSASGQYIRVGGWWRQIVITGLLIEDSHFENSHTIGMGLHAVRNSIIRHNLFEDLGFSNVGECFYIGETGGSQPIENVEIYGNTCKNYTQQCFDLKKGVGPVDIHHNICEGQAYKTITQKNGTEAGATIRTVANLFHDNIMRNGVNSPTNSQNLMEASELGGDIIEDNVIHGMSGHANAMGCNSTVSGTNSIIRNNLFCGSSPYTTESGCTGVTFTGNTTNAAQATCDAEVTRIINETALLPGFPGSSPTSQCSDSIDNDGDGNTDFPNDASCDSLEDNDEAGPLIGHWSFDNVATDASGHAIHGTLQGDATYATGQVNQALSLDGTDDYVSFGTSALLDLNSAVTVMAWVKTSSTSPSSIFTAIDGATAGYELAMGEDDSGGSAAGVLSFQVEDADAGSVGATIWEGTTQTINDNAWHHVAVTHIDGATKFYIDGQFIEEGSHPALVAGTGSEKRAGTNDGAANDWNGLIDELKVYNVARSAQQITDEYNAGIGGDIGLLFVDKANQDVSTVITSGGEVITPSNGTAISISETCTPACTGQYQIYQADCSTVEHAWTAVAGTVDNGECVELRLTTSSENSWQGSITVSVGAFSDEWVVTTVQIPPDPEVFSGSARLSNGATLSGGATVD